MLKRHGASTISVCLGEYGSLSENLWLILIHDRFYTFLWFCSAMWYMHLSFHVFLGCKETCDYLHHCKVPLWDWLQTWSSSKVPWHQQNCSITSGAIKVCFGRSPEYVLSGNASHDFAATSIWRLSASLSVVRRGWSRLLLCWMHMRKTSKIHICDKTRCLHVKNIVLPYINFC